MLYSHLQLVEGFLVFATDRLTVHLYGTDAETTGAADDDFVGCLELIKSERLFTGLETDSRSKLQNVFQADTRQDEIVTGMSADNAVLYHENIAVGTLGDDIAAVENSLEAALFTAALISDNAGDKIKSLDIAMEEAGVFHGDEPCLSVQGNSAHRSSENQQAGLYISRGEGMTARAVAAGSLPVEHTGIGIGSIYALLKLTDKLLTWHIKVYFQQLAAVVEAVKMILGCKNTIVAESGSIIYAITEINRSVGPGDSHFLKGTELAIVISYVSHGLFLRFSGFLVSENFVNADSAYRNEIQQDVSVGQVHIAGADEVDNAYLRKN